MPKFTIEINGNPGEIAALASIIHTEANAYITPSGHRARMRRRGNYGPDAHPAYVQSFRDWATAISDQIRTKAKLD